MVDSPKRVLFVNGVPMDIGGVEKTIMDVYRGLNHDKVALDVVVRKSQKGYYDEEIISYGGRIFNVFEDSKHKGNKKWNIVMDFLFALHFYKLVKREGPYAAVHVAYPKLYGIAVFISKCVGIPVRIVHSHNTGFDDKQKPSLFRTLVRKFQTRMSKRYSTHIWGCSKAACEFMFGNGIMKDERSEVVLNPIDIDKFMNVSWTRSEACKLLGLSSENMNFIHVGRFSPQKNQIFLLEMFAEMLKRKKNIHLLIIGSGVLQDQIKKKVLDLNIEDYVTIFPSDTNISLALSASNYFILPSMYEGFGNVLIEAQAASIPCFVSDVCQPEPNMGLVEYIPLDKGPKYWSEYILGSISSPQKKDLNLKAIQEYNLSNVAQRMQSVYLKGIKYKN